jgi:hypothetical protein
MEFKTGVDDQAALYRSYDMVRVAVPTSRYQAPARSPNPAPHRQHHPDTQTIAHIVTQGYFSIPNNDPVTAMVSDKKYVTWLGLDDVISQLRRRYEIYERTFYELELAKCAATNALHDWEAERGQPSDRQLDNLQHALQGLYLQQREERLHLWRDTSRLRQALPEWAQQYAAAVRKVDLLERARGDRA